MCVFSMDSGGGETYPIYLANQMRKDGYTVSIIDFGMAEHKEEIMKLIYHKKGNNSTKFT